MTNNLINFAGIKIDWWSISHIILYIYFGYIFPEYFVEFLLIGIFWEIFESFTAVGTKYINKTFNCLNSNNIFCKYIKKISSYDYWYGKFDDVVMNMIGFLIGVILIYHLK